MVLWKVGGILEHGLKQFTTIKGHKEESHTNAVLDAYWFPYQTWNTTHT